MSEQLELPVADASQTASRFSVFRPIHYLGSKLRLVDVIRDVVNAVDPDHGPICDLFAGSGTVSLAFAQERRVIAVDIQEYSRVLCSALLYRQSIPLNCVSHVDDFVNRSKTSRALLQAIEPLAAYERDSIADAIAGDPEQLCDLLENGSLLIAQRGFITGGRRELQIALKQAAASLNEARLLESSKSMVLRHFGGIYFSYRQAAVLDLILESVHTSEPDLRDFLLAPLLSTASNVVNTVGKHFAQPIRPRSKGGLPKRHLVRKIEEDRAIDVWSTYRGWFDRYRNLPASLHAHEALRADYRKALQSVDASVSVVYADPPYTRDHYSRFYHVLETLCFRDDPKVSSVVMSGARTPSRGLYRESRHQSPFCIKSQAPSAFEALFKGVREREIPLVVSYSPFAESTRARPRLMSIEKINSLAKRYYRSVEVASAGRIAHSKLNATELNTGINYDAEVLLACVP